MAFPQIEATNNSTGLGSSHIVALPANISAGETLICFFSLNEGESNVVTWPEGWTEILDLADGVTEVTLSIAWRKADGGEGASITVSTSISFTSAHLSVRISGATDPTSTPPEINSFTGTADANPDPPNLTPSGGSKNYLWIASCGTDTQEITGYPAGYENTQTKSASVTHVGLATLEKTGTSEDPGTFTMAGGNQWVAATIAVYEAPTGTNTQINIGDVWKEITGIQINIGDAWKTVNGMQINIGDAWKTVF